MVTPFGERMRALRAERGVSLRALARALEVSPAFLSALELGRKGRPAPNLVRQICGALGLIWDEADEMLRLAVLSHPRVVVDTSGLSPAATRLANRLSETIGGLDEATVADLLARLEAARPGRDQGP